MKTKTLIRPAIQTMESVPSCIGDDVSPNSSAIVGVTLLLGDLEDALAALRTAVLLARNLRATLSLNLPRKGVSSIHFGEATCSTSASGLLDSVRPQLRKLMSMHRQALVLEVSITAASFISEGSISMRIRSVNAGSGKSAT
jgi:hypothetical protein